MAAFIFAISTVYQNAPATNLVILLTVSTFWHGKRVLVTGGAGFVGSALARKLLAAGAALRVADIADPKVLGNLRAIENSIEFLHADLTDRSQAEAAARGMNIVINLAAKVGGIGYNHDHQGTMSRLNTLLSLNMLEASRKAGVERHVVVSSACVYGKECPIPMKESDGFLGDPESSNFGYGWAKRYAEVQARAYASEYGMNISIVRPFNAYGPCDRFDETGHVIASLIRRTCAGENPLTIWGTGRPTRSFLYVDDFAEGVMLLAEKNACAQPVNLCDDREVSIGELARLVCAAVGVSPELRFDPSKPDGQPRRSGDTSLARGLGFKPRIGLEDGLRRTVEWYRSAAIGQPASISARHG